MYFDISIYKSLFKLGAKFVKFAKNGATKIQYVLCQINDESYIRTVNQKSKYSLLFTTVVKLSHKT